MSFLLEVIFNKEDANLILSIPAGDYDDKYVLIWHYTEDEE